MPRYDYIAGPQSVPGGLMNAGLPSVEFAPAWPHSAGLRPRALRRPASVAGERLRDLLSLRPLRIDFLIVIAYIVVTRIFELSAAKVGIQAGPVPIFLTDMVLFALLAVSLVKRPVKILFWVSSGSGAQARGRAVWILAAVAVMYFIVAFQDYRMFAFRDLAIFGYAVFFPLVYWTISSRALAVRATRYFVYSGVILAILALTQSLTGVNLGIAVGGRTVFGQIVGFLGSDDTAGVAAMSLAGLSAYLLLERRRRAFHAACATLCFLALVQSGSRSALFGFALAGLVTFILVAHRYRLAFLLFAGVLAGAIALAPILPPDLPGVQPLLNFNLAVASATGGAADPNGAFRIARWKDTVGVWLNHPVFGIGFGADIVNSALVRGWEREGQFNVGMPHNTYLFLLARMGLIGLGLIVFCWISGILSIARAARRGRLPDDLAAVNVLVAMAGFAAFVLFFERPMNNASFWIMLAVAQRLADTSPAIAAREWYQRPHFGAPSVAVPAPASQIPAQVFIRSE